MSPYQRRVISTRAIFSLRVYLASSFILIPPVIIPRISASAGDLVGWTMAAVAGYLAVGVLVPVFRVALARGYLTPEISVASVGAIGACLGFAKGQVTAWVAVAVGVGLPGLTENVVRSVPSAILGASVLILIGLLLSAWSEFTSAWEHLSEEQVRVESARLREFQEQQATVTSLRTLVEDRLQETLNACRSALQDARNEPVEAQWSRLSNILRSAAEDHVRPLTRDLWRNAESVESAPSPWRALWSARQHVYVPVLWVIGLTVIGLIPAYAGSLSLAQATGFALAGGGAAGVVITLGNRLISRVPAPWVLVVSTMGASAGAAALGVGVLLGESYSVSEWVLCIAWQIVQAVTASIAALILSSNSSMVTSAQRQLDASRNDVVIVRRATQRLYRDMAQYLHGTVQSRLMASALALESHGDVDDEWREHHLRHADALLRAPLAEFEAAMPSTLRVAVGAVIERWSGVLTVDLNLDIQDEIRAAQHASDICAVVEEGLANASRHGLASAVTVGISVTESGVEINVQDDGVGPRAGEPGLGSALFDAVAPQAWSLTQAPLGQPGSVLRVTLN